MGRNTGVEQMDALGLIRERLDSPLHKNASYLMMNGVVTSGLGFIFWMIVARLYPPDEVGLASAIISSMLLLAMLGNLGFGIGLIRFLPRANKRDSNDMINSCLTICGAFSLVLAGIFLLGLNIWSPALIFIRKNIIFIFLFFLFTLTWLLTSLLNTIFISKRAANYVFIKDSGIFSSLKIVVALFIVPLGAFGIFSSWGIAALVAFTFSIIFFLKKIQPGYRINVVVRKDVINPMWHFSFGNYVGNIFQTLPALILPLMILNILSAPDAGYFYISWMIAGLLFMIPTAVSTSLLAEGSVEAKNFKQNLKKAIEFIFILLIPAVIFVFLFGGRLLSLIGGEYLINATGTLRLLALSSIPFAIVTLYVTLKRIEKKAKEEVFIYGTISFITFLLTYLLIGNLGLEGTGYAWLISQTFLCIAVVVPLKNTLKIK